MRKRIELEPTRLHALAAFRDSHLGVLREAFEVRIHARRGKMTLMGDELNVLLCEKAFYQLLDSVERGEKISDDKCQTVAEFIKSSPEAREAELAKVSNGKEQRDLIAGKTEGQNAYIDLMRDNVVTFAIGPAGTGKTYMAVGMAVQHLLAGVVERIILVRPAVEAGERLGFLPGDMNEKVRPYLMPVFDSLGDFLGIDRMTGLIERKVVEIAPLAYMRGRTLNNSFMILDEGQNTTIAQMKMFLTRIGRGSRAVITGDVTQVDLPPDEESGLLHAERVLQEVPDVAFCHLTKRDIVRHPVVNAIVNAYEQAF